jgi:trigger factor
MKVGEEKDLDITFPEDYHADLAGKPVVFHVKVNEIKESQAPVVDDEFAKDVSEFETLEAFRADLGKKLEEKRAEMAEMDFKSQIMEQVIGNMECEVPDGMIEVEIDRMLEQQAMQLQQYGISMEQYQQMMGVNEAMVRDSARPDALKSIQLRLALAAIAKAEGIEVSDEELEAEFNKLAEQYQIEIEKVKAAIAAEDLKNDLLMQKAQDLVVTSAKAKKKTTRKKKTDEAEEPKAE